MPSDMEKVLLMMIAGGLQGWLGGREDRQRLKQDRESHDWKRELFGLERDIANERLSQERSQSVVEGDKAALVQAIRAEFGVDKEAALDIVDRINKSQKQEYDTMAAGSRAEQAASKAKTYEAEAANASGYYGGRAANAQAQVSATKALEDQRRTAADLNRARTSGESSKKMDALLGYLDDDRYFNAAMKMDPELAGNIISAVKGMRAQAKAGKPVPEDLLGSTIAVMFSRPDDGSPSIAEIAQSEAMSERDLKELQAKFSLFENVVQAETNRLEVMSMMDGVDEDTKAKLEQRLVDVNDYAGLAYHQLFSNLEGLDPGLATAGEAMSQKIAQRESDQARQAKMDEARRTPIAAPAPVDRSQMIELRELIPQLKSRRPDESSPEFPAWKQEWDTATGNFARGSLRTLGQGALLGPVGMGAAIPKITSDMLFALKNRIPSEQPPAQTSAQTQSPITLSDIMQAIYGRVGLDTLLSPQR